MECTCCGGTDCVLTIELAVSGMGDEKDTARYYLPNSRNRANMYGRHNILEIPFCINCMRVLEDMLRAAILYQQKENEYPEKVTQYYDDNFKFETWGESKKISEILKEVKGLK